MAAGGDETTHDLLWFLGIVAVIGVLWFFTGGPMRQGGAEDGTGGKRSTSTMMSFFGLPRSRESAGESSRPSSNETKTKSFFTKRSPENDPALSKNYKKVLLRRGTSGYTSGISNLEYVILSALSSNKEAINISGWKLKNGRDERIYNPSGVEERFGVSAIVPIPLGNYFYTGGESEPILPIILLPGEKAYVVTGRMVTSSPYQFNTSFKVNKCSGYIENEDGYDFVPKLSTRCPKPLELIDGRTLDDACYGLVKSYSTCRLPGFAEDRDGNLFLDGRKPIKTSCARIMAESLNYDNCIYVTRGDKDFITKEWRIFLNHKGWPLWAEKRETITLLDKEGKIVDQISY